MCRWVYLPAYSCPCASRGSSRGCTYHHTHALVPLGGVLVGVLTSILLPLYLSREFSWVYLPAYSCPCTSRGVLVGVLTSILLPLYLSGEFSWVYLPAYSCPCTSRGSSRGCTYQHTPALVPLGEFSWVHLPAYSCPCTSRGSSRGCTYQHTPALVPLGGVLVGVLTSILLPLYLSGEFSLVYLPAYSCPCTSRGSSRGCTYQHTPALIPLGGVLVGVLTSILLPLYLSGEFSYSSWYPGRTCNAPYWNTFRIPQKMKAVLARNFTLSITLHHCVKVSVPMTRIKFDGHGNRNGDVTIWRLQWTEPNVCNIKWWWQNLNTGLPFWISYNDWQLPALLNFWDAISEQNLKFQVKVLTLCKLWHTL